MSATLPAPAVSRHLLRSDVPSPMAKAALRKPDDDAERAVLGRAIDQARQAMGWNLDEFALAVDRDPRQVARWISGKENAQFAALFAVPAFRGPLVIALAGLASDIEITTTIAIRRTA